MWQQHGLNLAWQHFEQQRQNLQRQHEQQNRQQQHLEELAEKLRQEFLVMATKEDNLEQQKKELQALYEQVKANTGLPLLPRTSPPNVAGLRERLSQCALRARFPAAEPYPCGRGEPLEWQWPNQQTHIGALIVATIKAAAGDAWRWDVLVELPDRAGDEILTRLFETRFPLVWDQAQRNVVFVNLPPPRWYNRALETPKKLNARFRVLVVVDVSASACSHITSKACDLLLDVVLCNPYRWRQAGQSLLLVGEADFSFAASLARIVEEDTQVQRLVATTLETENKVQRTFSRYADHEPYLRRQPKVTLLFEVDATRLSDCLPAEDEQFDRIVWLFPHSGVEDFEDREANPALVSRFMSSAATHLTETGEIHLALLVGQFERWKLQERLSQHGLAQIGRLPFDPAWFPQYRNRRGFRDDSFVELQPDAAILFKLRVNSQHVAVS